MISMEVPAIVKLLVNMSAYPVELVRRELEHVIIGFTLQLPLQLQSIHFVQKELWRSEAELKALQDAETRLKRYEELLREASRCWVEDAEDIISEWQESRRRSL